MSTQKIAEDTHTKVFEWLKHTPYVASSIEPLTGGQANFVYRAHLSKPLEDGTTDLIVKHGEPYMARHPANALTTARCDVEAQCLRKLTSVELRSYDAGAPHLILRIPKLYLYNEKTNTRVQEDLPCGLNLKEYALKNFPSPTLESMRPHAHQLGKVLAEYSVSFNRNAREEIQVRAANKASITEPKLFATLESNHDIQKLKHIINYDSIIQRIDQFPETLPKYKDVFVQVKQHALRELESAPEDLDALHGDWATVNILLSDLPLQAGRETQVLAVDWENAQLGVESGDHGEMLGEMYALWFYRRIDA